MKKGFTLVELLAVIVILSIIAIITIPMISNVIEKSKLGAMEDSAYGLIDAANYYYAEHMNEMSSNKIFVIENGIGTSEEKLNYKGKIEGNAKILLASNGKVALCLTNGKSYAKKGLTDSKVVMHTVSENTSCDITTSENGDVVIDITGGSTSDTINIKLEDMQRQIDDINSSLGNFMSYNPDTDYFGMMVDGEWKDVVFAGFKAVYLFKEGEGILNGASIKGATYTNINIGVNSITTTPSNSTQSQNIWLDFDFSKYSRKKLYIEVAYSISCSYYGVEGLTTSHSRSLKGVNTNASNVNQVVAFDLSEIATTLEGGYPYLSFGANTYAGNYIIKNIYIAD